MTPVFRLLLTALVFFGSLTGAWAQQVGKDASFEELAREIPGFRMITNKPPVPDTPFFDAAHQRATLQDFGGKALLVNFWATWCTPCVREMPALNALAEELGGEDFEVIAIASGQQVGKNPDVFLQEHQLDALDLYIDPHASMMTLFGTKTLPTTLVIDRKGRILGGVIGEADWTSDEARALLAHLMTEE